MYKLHAHIWNKDVAVEKPIELDLELTDIFVFNPPDESDHVQFQVELPDGNNLELRLPTAWLKPEVLTAMFKPKE